MSATGKKENSALKNKQAVFHNVYCYHENKNWLIYIELKKPHEANKIYRCNNNIILKARLHRRFLLHSSEWEKSPQKSLV